MSTHMARRNVCQLYSMSDLKLIFLVQCIPDGYSRSRRQWQRNSSRSGPCSRWSIHGLAWTHQRCRSTENVSNVQSCEPPRSSEMQISTKGTGDRIYAPSIYTNAFSAAGRTTPRRTQDVYLPDAYNTFQKASPAGQHC